MANPSEYLRNRVPSRFRRVRWVVGGLVVLLALRGEFDNALGVAQWLGDFGRFTSHTPTIVVLAVAGVVLLTVDLWLPLLGRRTTPPESVPVPRPSPRRSQPMSPEVRKLATKIASAEIERRRELVEKELVAIIDQGRLTRGDHFTGISYGAYSIWCRKTAYFLASVFGDTERQRFESDQGKSPESDEQRLALRLHALENLRDRPESWHLPTDRSDIERAIRERQTYSYADRIVLAGTPLERFTGQDAETPGTVTVYQGGEGGQGSPSGAGGGGGGGAGPFGGMGGKGGDVVVQTGPDPKLSFGRAKIGRWQRITAQDEDGKPMSLGRGRVIRVPVINAQGAGEARDVHARLEFGHSSVERDNYPEPAQGEWFGESGPELEINLSGNGSEHLLDVVVVLDKDYPQAFEWTRHSRAAGLQGFGIWANPFEVGVRVMGSGATPVLEDALEIEVQRGSMIRADWVGARDDWKEATNFVSWER